MFNSDCAVCKQEVKEGSKAIGCERCDDWFHMDCVGLRDVNTRALKCKNLVFLCKKCLANTKREWRTQRKTEEESKRKKEKKEDTDIPEVSENKETQNQVREHSYASVVKNAENVDKEREETEEEDNREEKTEKEQNEEEVQILEDVEAPEHHNHEETQESTTWLGVGAQAWRKVMEGKRMKTKSSGKLERKLWLFGDSILRGVGREIHYLTNGFYRIMDRTKGGADIENIERTVNEHISEMKPEDLAIIEGGGNGIEYKEEQETISAIHRIVEQVKSKISTNPLVMCIPKRRGKENSRFGIKRRHVNKMITENLEKWGCDGLHLWESTNWNEIWARDGVHLENIGQVWAAWNMVEWAQLQEKGAKNR